MSRIESRKPVHADGLCTLNKNRKHASALIKYYEYLDKQQRQHLREFHLEKAKTKDFLHNIHQTTGRLSDLLGDANSELSEVSEENGVRNPPGIPRFQRLQNRLQGNVSEGYGVRTGARVGEMYRSRSMDIPTSAAQSRTSSLSAYYSNLAENLNSKVRLLRPLTVEERNKTLFSQFHGLEDQLNFGVLSKPGKFSSPVNPLQRRRRVPSKSRRVPALGKSKIPRVVCRTNGGDDLKDRDILQVTDKLATLRIPAVVSRKYSI